MSKILYSKITKERKKEFQIITNIVRDDSGQKKAVKKALFKEGYEHIAKMKQYCDLYQLDNIKAIPCTMIGNEITFPFVEGSSYSYLLLQAIKKGDKQKVYELLFEYKKIIYNLGKDARTFQVSNKFTEIFGELKYPIKVLAGQNINIDNIMENIILTGAGYQIIDYEWMFDFYIPYNFVLYRAVLDMFVNHTKAIGAYYTFQEIMDLYEISQEEIMCYEHMNQSFNDYVFDNSEGYNAVCQKYQKQIFDVEAYVNKHKYYVQLYYDTGGGFSEENSFSKELSLLHYDEGVCKVEWTLPQGIRRIRLDPINSNGDVIIDKIVYYDFEGIEREMASEESNSETEGSNKVFISEDPNIVYTTEKDIQRIYLEMRIHPYSSKLLGEQMSEKNMRIQKYIERLKYNNNELVRYINDLTGSRQ